MGWQFYSDSDGKWAGHGGNNNGVSSEMYLQLTTRNAIGWVSNVGFLTSEEKDKISNKLMSAAQAMGSIVGSTSGSSCTKKTWNSNSCRDDSTFKSKKIKNCRWVGKSKKNLKKYCKKKVKGKFVKDWCPVTCTNC